MINKLIKSSWYLEWSLFQNVMNVAFEVDGFGDIVVDVDVDIDVDVDGDVDFDVCLVMMLDVEVDVDCVEMLNGLGKGIRRGFVREVPF